MGTGHFSKPPGRQAWLAHLTEGETEAELHNDEQGGHCFRAWQPGDLPSAMKALLLSPCFSVTCDVEKAMHCGGPGWGPPPRSAPPLPRPPASLVVAWTGGWGLGQPGSSSPHLSSWWQVFKWKRETFSTLYFPPNKRFIVNTL